MAGMAVGDSHRGGVRAPHQALRAMEAAWLPLEATGFWMIHPLLRTLGAGDQHPVLILPGFTTLYALRPRGRKP